MDRRLRSAFDGCYEAPRAAALAGVPVSTVYDWARKGVVVPSLSQERPKLWSYADLMALRIVYWLRHRKLGDEVPASPMPEVRQALESLAADGIDLWDAQPEGPSTPICVDRSGRILLRHAVTTETARRQGVLNDTVLDLLAPFDDGGGWAPDLRRPAPHLRIVPGKVGGEPHLAHSRLTTATVAALADRGFALADIHRLYPDEDEAGLAEAVDLEHRLAA